MLTQGWNKHWDNLEEGRKPGKGRYLAACCFKVHLLASPSLTGLWVQQTMKQKGASPKKSTADEPNSHPYGLSSCGTLPGQLVSVREETSINFNSHYWGPKCGALWSFFPESTLDGTLSFQSTLNCSWKENWTLNWDSWGFFPQRDPHLLIFPSLSFLTAGQRNLSKTQSPSY